MKLDNILFLDIETTGVDPKKHSIIQIAMEYHENGQKVASYNEKINTAEYATISLQALRYNETKMSALKSYGKDENLVLNSFIDFLLNLPKDKKIYICGHNVDFDISFIKEWMGLHSIEDLNSILPYSVVDTSTLGKFLAHVGKINVSGRFNFENLLKSLDITTNPPIAEGADITDRLDERLHDAAYDVKMTTKIFYRMLDLFEFEQNKE